MEGPDSELFVIHVASYQLKFLGNSKEGEALDYLFEKANEYGASLTVVRSDDILKVLEDEVDKHKITHVILGESREAGGKSSIISKLEQHLKDKAEIVVIPA